MTSNADFFSTRHPQAVLKHGVLTRYAYYFAARAGSATGGRVAFIDGYAGEGRYRDGNLGSPLLLASEAQRLTLLERHVKLAFVEHDDLCRSRLEASLVDGSIQPDVVVGKRFENAATDLMDRYADRAVLLFVDPFGLGIAFSTLVELLKRSSRAHPIDVL
jgi:three-Cys-motif partner protein